ncbi:MAG: DUF1203 domain-containing protein [Acidobacteriota bacterium]
MTTNDKFKIISIPSEVATKARESQRDVFDNLLAVLRDGERHQCRVCLKLSQPDEGVILMAHQPFLSRQPYAEVGPVFIHERSCEPYADINNYPPEFPRREVVLRAYNAEDRIVDAQAVRARQVEEVIAEMFTNSEIAYLHARNLGYGCYMFRIERPGSY